MDPDRPVWRQCAVSAAAVGPLACPAPARGAAEVLARFFVRFTSIRRLLPVLGLLLLLGASVAEVSQSAAPVDLTDLPLEALMNIEVPKVVGASKFEQKTTEAPSSITVVTADEISRYGHRTLADVLQSLQGFNVSYDRNYAFLGARGLSLGDFNSRLLLLVDGHRVNNNLTDGAFIDTAFILDIDLVDRVEVIRGPGSVLYGNNAFFGVVNVITRQGKQLNGLETSVDYGGFNTYKGRLTFGRQFTNGVQLLVSGSAYGSDGAENLFYKEFNTPLQNNGVAHNLDGDSYGSLFASLSYRDITFEGAINRREKGTPTEQNVTTFNDPRLVTIDQRAYTSLKFAHEFPGVVDVTAQVYYDRSDYQVGYPQSAIIGTNLVDFGLSTEEDRGEWWGAEVQLNKRLWDRHVISVGAEYRDDFKQEQTVSGQVPIVTNRQSHGVYVQGDFALRTNLHLSGGVRYDQYGHFDPTFNPRLALIYNPVEKTTFKALYGTAFRAPNFLELINPLYLNIRPEKITGYELVWEQEITPNLRSSVSGFFNRMDDLIVIENGSFTNFNADAKGLEFALAGAWTNGLRGRASYTLQHVRDRSGGRDLPDSPEHLVKFNVSVPLYAEKLFAGLEFQYTSSRHTITTSSGGGATTPGADTAGFGIFNFTLFSRNLLKNLELSASIYNLLDRHYSDPSSRYHVQDQIGRDGRSFRVKMTYRF